MAWMAIRACRDSGRDGVVAPWPEAFPATPAHDDPLDDVARRRPVQPVSVD